MSEPLKTFCCEYDYGYGRYAHNIVAPDWHQAERVAALVDVKLVGELVETIPCDGMTEAFLCGREVGPKCVLPAKKSVTGGTHDVWINRSR